MNYRRESADPPDSNGRPVLVNVWLERSEFREGSISM